MPVEQKKKIMYIIVGIISAIIFFFWAYEMSFKIKSVLDTKKPIDIPVDLSDIKKDITVINQKIEETKKIYNENIAEPTTEQNNIQETPKDEVPIIENKDQEILYNMEKALETIINTTSTTTE